MDKRRVLGKNLITILFIVANLFNINKISYAQEFKMNIMSPSFTHSQMIPKKYTCQGEDINPPLNISKIPDGTISMVLINDDPDAPGGTWDHWIVYNIQPIRTIKENSVPGIQGENSWGKNEYGGPCPPSGTHRYFFKLYALDIQLKLSEGATKKQVEKEMEGHILEQAEFIGLYKKS